ncbi:MAG: 4'-phosphopantetheinyl transferase superfamily protein [Pseudobdellovibrio sp.]
MDQYSALNQLGRLFSDVINQELKQDLFHHQVDRVDVQLVAQPSFGAQHEQHRLRIREHIIHKNDKNLKHRDKVNILNLNQIPKAFAYYFSVSHCLDMGGYIRSNYPIGFDIESTERIENKTLERVSQSVEIELVKNAAQTFSEKMQNALIWSAKESCFKALHIADLDQHYLDEVKVLSNITLTEIKSVSYTDTQFFMFKCQLSTDKALLKVNAGFATVIANHIYTVFLI